MTDVTQIQAPVEGTAVPAADAPLPPELQYLKDHGEDISEFLPKPAEGETKPAEGEPAPAANAEPKDDDVEPGEVRVGDDGRVRDAKGRFVPLGVLKDERSKRQTAEGELQKLREQLAAAQAKLEMTAKPAAASAADQQPKNPWDEPDIDPAQDIMGAVLQERRRNVWNREQQAKATQETTAALTEQQIVQAYRDDTQRFMAQRQDYLKAFEHVVLSRAAELIALGVVDKAAIDKQLKEDEAEIVRQAIAAKRRPAEVFYQLAIAKGYQAPAANPAANPPPASGSASGAQPAPAKTTAQQIIDNVRAGQEASKTLTGAGSGAGVPGLTIDQYADMDVDQILALRKTPQGMAQLKAIGAA